jgi:hypothetical protein
MRAIDSTDSKRPMISPSMTINLKRQRTRA